MSKLIKYPTFSWACGIYMDAIQRNEQITRLENIVAAMPGTIYWKDAEGRILGCNNNQAKVCGLNRNSMIGKTTIDLGEALNWGEDPTYSVHENSLKVISSGKQKQLEEILFVNEKYRTFLSCKNPLKDHDGKVIGLAGVSIEITSIRNAKKAENYLEKIEGLVTFDSTCILPKLSKREIECLYFMIRGMTAKQIGKVLSLSFRTVESYIENMKFKFNCYDRSELIGKAIDSGYINLTIGNPHRLEFN